MRNKFKVHGHGHHQKNLKSWILLYTCIYKLITLKSKYMASQDGNFFHIHQLDFDKHNEFKLNIMHINKRVYYTKVLFSLLSMKRIIFYNVIVCHIISCKKGKYNWCCIKPFLFIKLHFHLLYQQLSYNFFIISSSFFHRHPPLNIKDFKMFIQFIFDKLTFNFAIQKR
jgi:hypothetical protein